MIKDELYSQKIDNDMVSSWNFYRETASLLRNSGGMQITSIQNQRSLAQMKATEKDLIIVKEYVDENTSAFLTEISERPGLSKLLQDIISGKVKRVLAMSRDRWARDVEDWLYIWKTIVKYDVEVIFTTPQLDICRDPIWGEMIEGFLMSNSVQESINIGIRTSTGKIAKFIAGHYVNEHIPVGYQVNAEKTNLLKTNELEHVMTIFKRFEGGENVSDIAKYIRTLTGEKKWTSKYVEHILLDKSYCGLRVLKLNNVIYEREDSDIEKIITITKHEEITIKLNKIKEDALNNVVFNGVRVFCGNCRKNFTLQNIMQENFLTCSCQCEPIRESTLVDTLCYGIFNFLATNEHYLNRIMGLGSSSYLHPIQKELAEITYKIKTLECKKRKKFQLSCNSLHGQPYINAIKEIKDLTDQQNELSKRQQQLSNHLDKEVEKLNRVTPLLTGFLKSETKIRHLPLDEKRQLCLDLLYSVCIKDNALRILLKS